MRTINLNSDSDVLFGTICGEAEGETLVGKQAVAASIMERARLAGVHPHFGDGTVRGVCLAHAQFDCWLAGPDRNRIMSIDLDHVTPAQQECLAVATAALTGTLIDPTEGATYYYAPAECDGPAWLVGAKWCGQFGTQLFWRNVK